MTLFDDPRVTELLGVGLSNVVESAFRHMAIAEEEIARARGTDETDRDDPVWNAFTLLRATHDRMATEFVYRSHCRELLARVRDGEDTRPGTDAEIAVAIGDASMSVPLHGAVVGLQFRLFKRAFPEQYETLVADGEIEADHYERMYGSELDEWERKLRHRARQDWRKS